MSLLDPSFYLEFVPATELQPFTSSTLGAEHQPTIEELYLLLGLDPIGIDEANAVSFVLWTPPLQDEGCSINGRHSPYFTEDLFSYEMSRTFYWPGFNTSGRDYDLNNHGSAGSESLKDRPMLLYRRTPIEESTFCGELRQFWSQWNDVKITRDENQYYVLEALAAVKIRSFPNGRSRYATDMFVESIFRSQRNSNASEQESRMRELLGPEYNPSYRYTLQYIDPGELVSDEVTSSPVGEGSFGRVYKYYWNCKPATRGDIGATAPGFVALKIANEQKSKLDKTNAMNAQFFRELRLAHSALSGPASGLTRFFGFTRAFSNSLNKSMSLEHHREDSWEQSFALIFDFATEGTILDYLRRRLQPSFVTWNWLQVSSALESIAGGLSEIHKRGVLHRDIHPNNILVELETFLNTSEPSYSCNISDVGEGYIAAESDSSGYKFTNTGCGFGLREYQAPELKEQGHSEMSDMYAFGQLGVDMIRYSSSMLLDAETGQLRVPEKILHILSACLQQKPEDRYEAVLVVQMLEEITYALQTDGKINYVEEEDFSLELPARELSSWESSS